MSETALCKFVWFDLVSRFGSLAHTRFVELNEIAGAGFFTHATMIGVFMDLIRDKLSVASEMRS